MELICLMELICIVPLRIVSEMYQIDVEKAGHFSAVVGILKFRFHKKVFASLSLSLCFSQLSGKDVPTTADWERTRISTEYILYFTGDTDASQSATAVVLTG